MTPVLTVGGTDIPYEVRFSSRAVRKRIVVAPDGVVVVAPQGTPWEGSNGLHSFLEAKRRWVFNSVREIEQKHRRLLPQRYDSGAKLQYRGRWLMLDVRREEVEQVEIACRSKFHVVVPEELLGMKRLEAVRSAFDDWLRGRAKKDLMRFGRHHEGNLGIEATAYRLSNARTRWGSCSSDGVIRVNWRLIQAPRVVMEYVVAHELAHLRHMNHSPAFWRTLGQTMPNWAEARRLLKQWEEGHRAV